MRVRLPSLSFRLALVALVVAAPLGPMGCEREAADRSSSGGSGGGTGPDGSSSDETAGGGSSGASATSGSSDATDGDAGAGPVNGCTSFADRTAPNDARVLTWDPSLANAPERCMRIKVGQTVRWSADGASLPADFGAHPVAQQGGDKPNPVSGLDTETGEVSFDAPGTFGFVCEIHPEMTGAIDVVP